MKKQTRKRKKQFSKTVFSCFIYLFIFEGVGLVKAGLTGGGDVRVKSIPRRASESRYDFLRFAPLSTP